MGNRSATGLCLRFWLFGPTLVPVRPAWSQYGPRLVPLFPYTQRYAKKFNYTNISAKCCYFVSYEDFRTLRKTIDVGIIVFCALCGCAVFIILMMMRNKDNDDNDELNGGELKTMDGHEVIMSNGRKESFTIDGKIYDDTSSLIFKAVMNGGTDIVVKLMKNWGGKLELSQEREIELMKKLENEYIVKFYGTCFIEGRVGIVMEYVEFGSLETFMSKKQFNGELKIRYAKDICLGMRYLHSQAIIHRDLKLSNVLVVH